MRVLFQLAGIVSVALGVGMIVAGCNYSSDLHANGKDLTKLVPQTANEIRDVRYTSTVLLGFGSGFLTVGLLGLIVPWINSCVYRRRSAGPSPAPGPTV